MQIATHHSAEAAKAASQQHYQPLESVTRSAVDTATAAYYLNRQPQTLRGWASSEAFPDGLRCLRINGRLAWPVSQLRSVLGIAA